MPREVKRASIGLRLKPSLKTYLENWATLEHRSTASLVEKILADAARDHGYHPVAGEP